MSSWKDVTIGRARAALPDLSVKVTRVHVRQKAIELYAIHAGGRDRSAEGTAELLEQIGQLTLLAEADARCGVVR